MGRRKIIVPPEQDGPVPGPGPLFAGFVLTVGGAWSVDHFTAHALGAWRYIPVAVLSFSATAAALLTLIMAMVWGELSVTDRHLVARTVLRTRRWSWAALRDVRAFGVGHPDSVRVLTLVTADGAVVLLPTAFRTSDAPGQAGLLAAELRERRPGLEPLDDDELARTERQVREALEAESSGRRRVHPAVWPAAVAAVLTAACVETLLRIPDATGLRLAATVAVVVLLVLTGLALGLLRIVPKDARARRLIEYSARGLSFALVVMNLVSLH